MEQTKIINANDRSVKQILDNIKYTIDVFQREYKWGRKHMEQLVDDLTSKFLAQYKDDHDRQEVANYRKYFLGSMVLCLKEGERSIIDGQQRLTSLTLLLIYLNNLQKDRTDKVKIDELIFSEQFAKKSFNLNIDDRKACMDALFSTGTFTSTTHDESVVNIVQRYSDIEELFPEELKTKALPYFIDWLKENVVFVEIMTYSDDDAYTIFETMNDRGLNLTSAEMLKGYLISNLATPEQKLEMNEVWKSNILKLKEIGDDEDLEFFKAWLRAKYGESIRQGKRGSENEDFEKLGTRFHSWVRDNKDKIGLHSKQDFYTFIQRTLVFYIDLYKKINHAADNLQPGLESIYYIKAKEFTSTFYSPLLLAPIEVTDDESTITKKLEVVSKFIEMFIVFRSVNYKTLSYSSIRYTMFSLVKEIRGKDVKQLTEIFKKKVTELEHTLEGVENLEVHGQNKRFIRFLLARITSYIEVQSGMPSKFAEYMDQHSAKPFEIEHIWSDKFEEHRDEFDQRDEWEKYRDSIGALLLIPRGFNQSYGDLTYNKKLPHYYGQNLLAQSLDTKCYEMNPSFKSFIKESGLPFKPHEQFKKNDIIERRKLYQQICEHIYNVKVFDTVVE